MRFNLCLRNSVQLSKRSKVIRLVLAFLMTFTGGIIYVISRHDIIFFNWIPYSILKIIKDIFTTESFYSRYIFTFCLPDGLWYFSILLFQSVFLGKTFLSKLIFYISVILPFVWELLQKRRDIPGTFDIMDIFVYIISLILFLTTNINYEKE